MKSMSVKLLSRAPGASASRVVFALAAGLALGGAAPPAAAQAQTSALATMYPLDSIYLLPHGGMRLPSAHQTAHDVISATRDEPSTPAEVRRAEPAYGASVSRATLLEMPADVIPGRYTRPKYALGFRSDTMKSFAQGMGLDADTCLLPLVRARVSLSQDAGTGGRLMVFARCTFN